MLFVSFSIKKNYLKSKQLYDFKQWKRPEDLRMNRLNYTIVTNYGLHTFPKKFFFF